MSRGSLPTAIGAPAIVPTGRDGVAVVVGSATTPPPPAPAGGRSSSSAAVATPASTSTAVSISATVRVLFRGRGADSGPDGYDGGPGGAWPPDPPPATGWAPHCSAAGGHAGWAFHRPPFH